MTIQILRRNFLKGVGAISAAAALPGLSAMSAYAQSDGDYKALVCVFLYGGCDGNNVVVPTDGARYAAYAQSRPGVAIPHSRLVPLPGVEYGLNPGLAPLRDVWANGDLAVLFNAGTLAEPVTRARLMTQQSARPESLFSHDEQQLQMQSAIVRGAMSSGWGSRLADAVQGLNAGSTVPPTITVAGNDLFLRGDGRNGFSVPTFGSFGLAQSGGGDAQLKARRFAMQQMLGERGKNFQVRAAAQTISGAINSSGALAAVLGSPDSVAAQAFQAVPSANQLAMQLRAVARMVEGRATLGNKRQVFFVAQGGFDHHQEQARYEPISHSTLGPALRAFYDALVAIGAQDRVTLFTLSDFGRTLRENDGGSDHAWGNHHLIMGGAVNGGRTYGTFPDLALGGPDDVDRDGRWIPTIAVDQYASTLARWFGVPDADLPAVVPNIGRFAAADLGFMA